MAAVDGAEGMAEGAEGEAVAEAVAVVEAGQGARPWAEAAQGEDRETRLQTRPRQRRWHGTTLIWGNWGS